MDNAKQHWKILQELGNDLANRVREFMVIGSDGEGVIVVTEDGDGYWLGEMRFRWGGWRDSKTATIPTPLNVPGLVQMAQGYSHILLLNKRGKIYAMGKNKLGQLGLGTADNKIYFSPQLISIPHKFISVRCGLWHSLALTDDGKVWAWGSNYYGQVGQSKLTCSNRSYHQILKLDSYRVVAVECGAHHSLALTDQGEVYAWGQFYNWSLLSTYIPTQIATPSPVQSMAAGDIHTLLLTRTGEVYAWGGNERGQLGLPKSTMFSGSLIKVAGLPPISQIASHPATNLSIALSTDQRCFVWGEMADKTSVFTPWELPSFYSTVESPLSFFSSYRYTPHSVTILETLTNQLFARMSRMFDNPKTSPDVQFVVEQRTIHAHRIILKNSSDYFAQMFSERVNPEDPIVKVSIFEFSYEVFYSFLRFLYTGSFEVYPDLLPQMFELASEYLESNLQQLCFSRMRTTITPATCCFYYPLTHRHSLLPELATFQQELVQFASTRMSEVVHSAAYQAMKLNLRDNLTNAAQNFLDLKRAKAKPNLTHK